MRLFSAMPCAIVVCMNVSCLQSMHVSSVSLAGALTSCDGCSSYSGSTQPFANSVTMWTLSLLAPPSQVLFICVHTCMLTCSLCAIGYDVDTVPPEAIPTGRSHFRAAVRAWAGSLCRHGRDAYIVSTGIIFTDLYP